MKGDVGMAGVQIMKKEVNKTTTTTNTSYSIPTSFVGTAYIPMGSCERCRDGV